MRRLYIVVVLVLFLGGYALAAQRMETVRAEGKTILLALAPVDPRAPLMGDYMALRYVVNEDIRKALTAQRIARENAAAAKAGGAADTAQSGAERKAAAASQAKNASERERMRNAEGLAVLRITNDHVPQAATFVRLYDGSPVQADEFLLAYRLRGHAVTSVAPAFYFQEGTASQYAGAKYGVFKLAADGKTLLVGLR